MGSRPLADDEGSDRVKLSILELLNRKYGIVEEDFISAELSAVPAFRASDVGFDRSLIGAYGHDDRVCAYASLAAILQLNDPERTAVCMLADKEEIGSEGGHWHEIRRLRHLYGGSVPEPERAPAGLL